MEKIPHSYRTIRFQDCDPLNHLNNARYLDYFMNAREDHLSSHYGLDIYDRLKKTGKTWVVARNEIEYRIPANLMEKVMITSQLMKFSLKHLEVEMAMYDEEGKRLKALLRVVFIPFDIVSGKVVEHDQDIMDLLESIRVEGIAPDMKERIGQLEGRV